MTRTKPRKSRNANPPPTQAPMAIPIAAVVLMFAIAFVGTSAVSEISAGAAGVYRMNPDWRGALVWMDRNTPDTGVDPYGVYEKETFVYPEGAYSVMSWWDYGHMITYFANRIPVANPFQAGVAGQYGAAMFFMTDDEGELDRIAAHTGIRYVVTDIEMATGKFWAMATWYNATEGVSPYQQVLLVAAPASGPDQYTTSLTYNDAYYLTTIARLHIYDGSMTPAGQAFYVETVTSPEAPYPVVTKAEQMNRTDADTAAARYNLNAAPDRRAMVVSPAPFVPTLDVPALHRFRLVYESGNQYVKIFEYVPGARIPGDGTIEHVVTTNTGRQFVWRASSVDGTFMVPYAGEYTIVGTGRVVVVPEETVLVGGMVQ